LQGSHVLRRARNCMADLAVMAALSQGRLVTGKGRRSESRSEKVLGLRLAERWSAFSKGKEKARRWARMWAQAMGTLMDNRSGRSSARAWDAPTDFSLAGWEWVDLRAPAWVPGSVSSKARPTQSASKMGPLLSSRLSGCDT